MEDIKTNIQKDDDLVRDTQGGEMPDPNRKVFEKASDAADVFKRRKQNQGGQDENKDNRQDQKKKAN
jgi:hypothetical protein